MCNSKASKILFVCDGNTCRSPIFQFVFNKLANEMQLNVIADSAGLVAGAKETNTFALDALNSLNINIYKRSSKIINKADALSCDIIFCMEFKHAEYFKNLLKIVELQKSHAPAIYELSQFNNGNDIQDPYGKGEEEYILLVKNAINICKKIIDLLYY